MGGLSVGRGQLCGQDVCGIFLRENPGQRYHWGFVLCLFPDPGFSQRHACERDCGRDQYHSVFPMPEEIGDLIDLELEFTLDVGYRLFDTLDDTAITQHENGYTVKLTLPENNWLYDFLMSFGDKVTIIQPKSIRQTLKAKHEAARNHHTGE